MARPEKAPEIAAPSPEQKDPQETIAELPEKHRRFVLALLDSGDLGTALEAAGLVNAFRILGNPKVRAAIEACAPLVGDSKKAAKILAPYLLERLTRVALRGSDAQVVSAGRDLLAIAGEGPSPGPSKPVDLGSLVRAMAEARRRPALAAGRPNGIGRERETVDVTPVCAPEAPDTASGDSQASAPAEPPPEE